MTSGKQKIDAQGRNAGRNHNKGSQLHANVIRIVICPKCKVHLGHHSQLVDHYKAKHPGENPPK